MDKPTEQLSEVVTGFAAFTARQLDRLCEVRPDVDRHMHGLVMAMRVLMRCEKDLRDGHVAPGKWQGAFATLNGFIVAKSDLIAWEALRELFEQTPDWATAHILQYVGEVRGAARVESAPNN